MELKAWPEISLAWTSHIRSVISIKKEIDHPLLPFVKHL